MQNVAARNSGVARIDNLSEFQRTVSHSFVPLRVSTGRAAPFHARLAYASADSVGFTEVSAAPHLVERTQDTIECGGEGYFKVSLLLEGTSVLIQDGRELVMRTGDIAVYDTSRPYSLLFTEQFRNLIMMFPKDRLELPRPFTEQLTAVSLSENSGLAPILATFLAQFPEQLSVLPSRVRAKLAHTSLGLVSTLFSEILDAQPEHRDPHQLLIQQIFAFIDAHLGDPRLSPSMIAAAHYISVRHLHALFAEIDTTVSTVIRQRRLERSCAELLDPAHATRTIAAIAARWGFTDATHFSRLFKRSYGVSPSEYRMQ